MEDRPCLEYVHTGRCQHIAGLENTCEVAMRKQFAALLQLAAILRR
jgi:hypothetical protein